MTGVSKNHIVCHFVSECKSQALYGHCFFPAEILLVQAEQTLPIEFCTQNMFLSGSDIRIILVRKYFLKNVLLALSYLECWRFFVFLSHVDIVLTFFSLKNFSYIYILQVYLYCYKYKLSIQDRCFLCKQQNFKVAINNSFIVQWN